MLLTLIEEHGQPCPELASDILNIPLDDSCLELSVRVGKALDPLIKDTIVCLLRQYRDVFAFDPLEMLGIIPNVMQHRLNAYPSQKPVIPKRRHLGVERSAAVATEVKKLLEAGFLRESQYPEWVSNVVLVKKPNETWRMCANFTNLNKACPKDNYALVRSINWWIQQWDTNS